ncbi:MFS transporter [Pullulanibacillus sp. KACC 23026]|uniref:MFS transporter n=1 Tax=Pullulanibacillus sp. KACC 23026 TaxID=3028315 RepID=UPI0023AF4BD8|nr:MFS transporter [Pullulanibacillus sp. KACC 23026]WEG11114.1 MFS transporter [Pullulanibacillus sp. KACC 23026]
MNTQSANAKTNNLKSIIRPRGKNIRWTIVAVLTLLSIVNYLDRGNLSVAAPLIMKDLHISTAKMGFILSSFVWPYAVMNLPSGWAVDRFGTKILMTISVAIWSIVSVLTGFARAITAFILFRVVLGVGESVMFPAAIKATNAWFPKNEKGTATSIFICGTQIGLAISPLLCTALMLAFGWVPMFFIIGSIGFLALIGWVILYNDPEKHKWVSEVELAYIKKDSDEDKAEKETAKKTSVTWAQWFKLFGHYPIWAMMIGNFALQYLFWFYITWLPTYLVKAQGLSISKTGIYASLPFIAGALGVLLGGKISDLIIKGGRSRLDGRRLTIALGAFLTAIALLITAFAHSPGLAVTLLTIGMFTYSLCSAPIWALATDVVETPKFIASIGSIQNFGGFLGGAFAPIITGFLISSQGGFTLALIVTGILALISAVMYGLVLRKNIPV